MIVIETVTFYKAIVIEIDLFESRIIDERHFRTKEEAEQFQIEIVLNHNNMVCIVYQM